MPTHRPLLQLAIGNLQDAVTLGLLEIGQPALSAIQNELIVSWGSAPTTRQEGEFDLAMQSLKSKLDRLHRPWATRSTRKRTISTVITLNTFVRWYVQGIGPLSASQFDEWKDLLDFEAADPRASHLTALALKFSADFGSNSPSHLGGREIEAKSLGLTSAKWVSSTWRSRRKQTDALLKTAQFWRDTLGLVHIQDSGSTPLLAKQMRLRLSFECNCSGVTVDRSDWIAHTKTNPKGIWLIRPTMVHLGNKRFVQGHLYDGPVHAARRFGRTRDLADALHANGAQEFLLICGDEAKLKFVGISLLDGTAMDLLSRDNSDDTFVKNIGKERGW